MPNEMISVIVPAYNAGRTIVRCAESLMGLDYPNYEVIVVNDGSTDNTLALVKEFEKSGVFTVIDQKNSGPSASRNKAIALAKGEYIAFTDSDCIVEKNWLTELMKGFNASNPYLIMGVGGDQQSPADETEFGRDLSGFFRNIGMVADYVKDPSGKTAITETEHNPTCNVVYRKEVFGKVGLFNENLWPGEDVELDYKIRRNGFKLMFNPSAVVYHYRPENIKQYRGMMLRYGLVQALLVKKYGFFRKIQYIPFFVLFMLLTLAAAAFVGPQYFFELLGLQLLSFGVSFYINTKNVKQSLKYLRLFAETLAFWNAGFVKGMALKK